MAQNHHVSILGFLLFRQEATAEHRLNPQQRKEVSGNLDMCTSWGFSIPVT